MHSISISAKAVMMATFALVNLGACDSSDEPFVARSGQGVIVQGATCCGDSSYFVAGCSGESAVERCVCSADPYCCNVAWDNLCVARAASSCQDQCSSLNPGDQGGEWRNVTNRGKGIVPTLWFDAMGFDISDTKVGGETYWAIANRSASRTANHRIYRKQNGQFVEQTKTHFPGEHAQTQSQASDAVFGDFNNDGHDDLLFVSAKHMTAARLAIYNPKSKVFVDAAYANEGILGEVPSDKAFFEYKGHTHVTPLYGQASGAIALNLKGISAPNNVPRDDIFIATAGPNAGSNYIYENRYNSGRPTKFKVHKLDQPLPCDEAYCDDTLGGLANARRHGINRDTKAFVPWDIFAEGRKAIIAADYGLHDRNGLEVERLLHIYAYDDNACVCGNGICEVESASNGVTDWYNEAAGACAADCAPGEQPTECRKYADRLDRVSLGDTRAGQIGVIDFDGDDDTDIIVFDMATSKAREAQFANCYFCTRLQQCIGVEIVGGNCIDLASQKTIPRLSHKAFRNDNGQFVATDVPVQFSAPYWFVTAATSGNFNPGQTTQPGIVVHSDLTPYIHEDGSYTATTLFNSMANLQPMVAAQCPNLDRGVALQRPAKKMLAKDIDGDGVLDVAVQLESSQKVLYGTKTTNGVADGCLEEYSRVPMGERRWRLHMLLADFNGDNRQDIFAASYGYSGGHPAHAAHLNSANSILFQEADGSFRDDSGVFDNQSPQMFSEDAKRSYAAEAPDLDNDGMPDLIVTNNGSPLQLFHNRIAQGQGMVQVSNWLPPYLRNCGGRCLKKALAVGDFNNDGLVDIAVGSAKEGINDILFNNIGRPNAPASCPANLCAERRLISAKHELGIDLAFPTNQSWNAQLGKKAPVDGGGRNFIRTLRTAFVDGDDRIDLVVAAGFLLDDKHDAAVFLNRIGRGSWPNNLAGNAINFDNDHTQWMKRVYLPSRENDGRALHCLQVADFNNDGAPDVFMATAANDADVPDLKGNRRLVAGCKKNGSTADCHIKAVCNPSLCEGQPNVDTVGYDSQCCTLSSCRCDEDDTGKRIAGSCDCGPNDCQDQSSEVCEINYYGEIVANHYKEEKLQRTYGNRAITRSKLLLYLNNNITAKPGFERREMKVSGSAYPEGNVPFVCGVADFNLDGKMDVFVSSYGQGESRDQAEIVANRHYPRISARLPHQRLMSYRTPSLMLLNPGWNAATRSFVGPFARAPFPGDVGKVYSGVFGNIDGEEKAEIILGGEGSLAVFDND
jgi:hypothetical protein